MTPVPPQPDRDPTRRDLLNRYAEGYRDAVDAVLPNEPSKAEWDAVRTRIRDRLNPASSAPAPRSGRWRAAVLVAVGAVLSATAASAAWIAFGPAPVVPPEVADPRPIPPLPDAPTDPLAEFAVLPMAGAEEVDISRVPGSGWLPVGSDPLSGALTLATTDEVELDDPDSVWHQVTLSPGDAPMIFAAKPR